MQSDNDVLMSGMKKKLTATDFVSEKNRVKSYPDFAYAYAGLVLIKHYNNLSYYHISLGAL